ncbi:MAG: PEGA domain-containing protein [Kofleriaceae bacterium]
MTTSSTPTSGQKTKALCIATRCASVEQFIATFHRFCDESSFFVATMTTRPVGLETAFSIQLESGSPVLRGYCVVLEAWSTPANRFGRPGVRLGVRRLTTESMPVFKQLQTARVVALGSNEVETPLKPPRTITPSAARTLTPNTLKRADGTPSSPVSKLTDPASIRAEGSVAGPPRPPTPAKGSPTTGARDPGELAKLAASAGPLAAPPDLPPAAPPSPLNERPATTPPARESYDVVRADATPIPTVPTDDRAATVPAESRAPGSSFILPANPLMNLSDESLEGFIDCSLYEETANFMRPSGDLDPLIDLDDPPAPPPPPLVPRNALSTGPVPTVPDPAKEPSVSSSHHEVFPHVVLPVQTMPLPVRTTGVQRFPVPPIEDSGSLSALDNPTLKRWGVIGGAAAVLVLLVIIIIVKVAGSNDPVPAVAEQPPAATADNPNPASVAVPEPPSPPSHVEPAPNSADPQPSAAATDPNGNPVIGSGPCRMNIATTPAGSIVKLDGAEVGPSPLTVAGPCAKRRIDVSHPRYQTATRFATPTEAKPASIDVTLIRPTHSLTITTVPSGATIMISGRRAGTSPTTVKLMGFTPLNLTFQKAGYKPTSQKIYSKVAQDRITIRLEKK